LRLPLLDLRNTLSEKEEATTQPRNGVWASKQSIRPHGPQSHIFERPDIRASCSGNAGSLRGPLNQMVNGNPGVHYGVAKMPRQAMDNGERAKKFGALGRALTSWLTATKRIEPLKASAESDRELEGRSPRAPCLERNSLLFPARVGRDLHPAPRIYLRFPMFISLAGFRGRRVLGDFPAKFPEARDFPLIGRPVWPDWVLRHELSL
jgi:hypothetical protein